MRKKAEGNVLEVQILTNITRLFYFQPIQLFNFDKYYTKLGLNIWYPVMTMHCNTKTAYLRCAITPLKV